VWECKKCRESVEDTFEVCWNCGTSREGVEDSSFRADVDTRVVAEAAGGGQLARRPSEVLPSGQPLSSPGEDHGLARGLIWVFRALALLAGVWGLFNLVYTVEAYRATREVVQEFKGFPGDQERMAQVAQRAAALAVFTAVITAVAVVAFPLGMAEVIRLCLLVDANTRGARQGPLREKAGRGRK
jgi:hypothetical protein